MGALERQAKKSSAEGIDPVIDVSDAEFLLDHAAFLGLEMQTIEGSGEALLFGGIGQEIAGKLPSDEFIERQVLVVSFDNPIAVRPHWTRGVHLITVGIGETGEIEPCDSHAFAVAR